MNRFDSDYAYSDYTRYMKKCGSWMACAAKGEKGVFNFDYWIDRKAIYQYAFKGSVKICEPFSDKYKIVGGRGKLIDVKEFYRKTVVFEFLEDTEVWGFNKIDDREDWNGRLLEDGNVKVEKESALVCLDGNPVVNGITLNRYDYDDLTIDKLYDINLNDGVLALFTRR